MIKKVIILTIFLLGLINISYSQDNNLQAIAYYNKAETSFNNSAYEEVLDYLKQAETLLGSTNSKILYLKIQTLNLLTKIDDTKIIDLKRAIAQFYQYTDQNNYPADKYLSVVNIEIELKEYEKALVEKQKQEEADFIKAKNSEGFEDLKIFLGKYPNSKYLPQLNDKIAKWNEQKNQTKINEQKLIDDKKLRRRLRGVYLDAGFDLLECNCNHFVKDINFLGMGVGVEIGTKFYSKKIKPKKNIGVDVTWFTFKYHQTQSYRVKRSGGFESGYSNFLNFQFIKVGPSFAWNSKNMKHVLFFKFQVGLNFSMFDIWSDRYYYKHEEDLNINISAYGLGPVFTSRVEYMYRKLFLGVGFQYSLQKPIDGGFGDDLGNLKYLHYYQISIPSIGVKF